VTGGWRKLHNEKLHNLHSSPSTSTVIKSGTMSWVGHAARMGKMSLLESLNGRDHSEDLGLRGRIILKRIFGKRVCGCGLDTSGSG
jgi:hypothetical protein